MPEKPDDTPPTPPADSTPPPTPQDAHAEATAAAEAEARKADPTLTDEQIKAIGESAADGVLARLEARGVFDEPEPEPQSAPAPEPSGAAPEAPSSSDAAPGAATDEKPARKSLAARFMGH